MPLENLKKSDLVALVELERQRVARLEHALRHVRAQRTQALLDEVSDLESEKTELEQENEALRLDLGNTQNELDAYAYADEHHALCNAYRKDRPGDCICSHFN